MTFSKLILSLQSSGKSKIVRDTLGVGLTKLLAVPFSLGLAIFLAKGMGPTGYGRYAFVVSLLNLMTLLVAGGLSSLLTREVAIALEINQPGLIRGVTRISTIWIILGSVLIISITALLATGDALRLSRQLKEMLLIGLIALPFACFLPVCSGILRGFGEAMQSQLPSLLALPALQAVVIATLMACECLNEYSAMMSFVFANVVVAAIGLYLVGRRSGSEIKQAIPVISLGSWGRSWFVLTQGVLANYLNIQAGVLLLGFLASEATVGAYHIAERVSQFVVLSIGILELVIAPHLARAFSGNRLAEVAMLFNKARTAGLIIAIPLAVPFVLFGQPIIQFVFGQAYVAQASTPLAILSVVLLLRAATGPASMLLIMSGNERITLSIQFVVVAINVAVSFAMIPQYGATGAAVGAGAGTLVWSALMALQARRVLKSKAC